MSGTATVKLIMPLAQHARLKALLEKTEADSFGVVIANALRLYEHIISEVEAGKETLDLHAVFGDTLSGVEK